MLFEDRKGKYNRIRKYALGDKDSDNCIKINWPTKAVVNNIKKKILSKYFQGYKNLKMVLRLKRKNN